MSIAKTLSSARRTKQFQKLTKLGLVLTSTDRQLQNGTLSFSGYYRVGDKTVVPTYSVTANGAVISNEFVARRVKGEKMSDVYKSGLQAVSELLTKRLAAY